MELLCHGIIHMFCINTAQNYSNLHGVCMRYRNFRLQAPDVNAHYVKQHINIPVINTHILCFPGAAIIVLKAGAYPLYVNL